MKKFKELSDNEQEMILASLEAQCEEGESLNDSSLQEMGLKDGIKVQILSGGYHEGYARLSIKELEEMKIL